MKHIYKVALLLSMIFLLSACQGDGEGKDSEVTEANNESTNDATATTDNEKTNSDEETTKEVVVEEVKVVEAEFGGVLRIAAYAPTTLNPIDNDRQSVQQVLELVYESLFELDESLKPVPLLVDTYEFDNGGKALKIKLKEGVLFHDGTPLTTADVDYSIFAIRDAQFSSYTKNVLPIKNVIIEDDLNMTLYFEQGYAFALNDLTFPVVSKTYVTGETYSSLVPVGTGAYAYEDYQQMQHIDLIANSEWHGGSVYVERIHCIVIDDDTSYETLFDQHLIDVMNPSKFNWLKYSENDEHKIDGYTSSYYDFVGFNFDNEILSQVEVRKAIANAIDREFILYDRFVNHGVLANSPVIPGSWYETSTEQAYSFDIEKAKSMIPSDITDRDEDGFYDMQDGVDSTTFKTIELRLLVNANNPLRVDMANYIQEDLGELGFLVKIESVEADVYYDRVKTGEFDLLYGGWKLSQVPDYVALFDSNGGQNYMNYSSKAMDQALEGIIDSYTDEQIITSVAKFEQVMIEELPYVSMYFLEGAVMKHDHVYGEFGSNTESMFKGIKEIYLDFEK